MVRPERVGRPNRGEMRKRLWGVAHLPVPVDVVLLGEQTHIIGGGSGPRHEHVRVVVTSAHRVLGDQPERTCEEGVFVAGEAVDAR